MASTVLALPASHWEALGARFIDDRDSEFPQRIATGTIATRLDPLQRFAFIDEGDVTTLLVPSDRDRRSLLATGVLFALGDAGYIDLSRDVLQSGIGDDLPSDRVPESDPVAQEAVAALRAEMAQAAGHVTAFEPRHRGAVRPAAALSIQILDEERVRDQLSAAEELAYVGHSEPALLALAAALEGALRIRATGLAGAAASAGALLETLMGVGIIGEDDYEVVYEALAARDRLVHGFAPEARDVALPERLAVLSTITLRILESPQASVPQGRPSQAEREAMQAQRRPA